MTPGYSDIPRITLKSRPYRTHNSDIPRRGIRLHFRGFTQEDPQ